MKLGLINSAWAQAGKGTQFGIEQTKRIGFDTIDIFADPLDIDQASATLIKYDRDELGLPIKSVCCVAVGLIDFNPSVQRFHVDRVKKYLDLCKEFGGDNLLLVLGEYIWEQQVIPPAEQWKTGVENMRECREVREDARAGDRDRAGAVQAVAGQQRRHDAEVPRRRRPAERAGQLRHLAPAPGAARRSRTSQRLKGRIAHVHLSDCDGKVHGDLPPGRGVTPIKEYLAAIRDTGFDRTVSIELEYSPQPERIVEWVKEAYAKTDPIMRELDLPVVSLRARAENFSDDLARSRARASRPCRAAAGRVDRLARGEICWTRPAGTAPVVHAVGVQRLVDVADLRDLRQLVGTGRSPRPAGTFRRRRRPGRTLLRIKRK